MTKKKISCCENCGKSEDHQHLVSNFEYKWCLDCMRLAGLCISCGEYIPPLVEDYFIYEDDECPECAE